MTTINVTQPRDLDGKYGHKTHAEMAGPLTDAEPYHPTKVKKSTIRKVLPTKTSDEPIFVFEHEGQQMWSNRIVILDAETIDPFLGDLEVSEEAPVMARVEGSGLIKAREEMPEMSAFHKKIESTEAAVGRGADSFSLDDAEVGTDESYDDHIFLVSPQGRRTAVNATYLKMAVGSEDLSKAPDGITIEQVPLGNGNQYGYTPLVFKRNGRLIGLVMPMRVS